MYHSFITCLFYAGTLLEDGYTMVRKSRLNLCSHGIHDLMEGQMLYLNIILTLPLLKFYYFNFY